MKEYAKTKLKRGIILSIIAVIVVFIAMPASFAIVESWNNNISNEYETYVEFNNETKQITSTLYDIGGVHAKSGLVYLHYNATNARIEEEQTLYDKNLFTDGYYRVVLSTSDTSDSSTSRDILVLGLNVTAYDLVEHAANRIKIHIDASKPVFVVLKYQDATVYGDPVFSIVELNSTTNYTYTTEIDLAKLLSLENKYPDGHFTLVVKSYNETEELSPGDVIILDWEFQKKKGAVATIYTVDNLMFGWGIALFFIGFASTPFFNPLSRDMFPFITKYRRSRAAKRAAAKRRTKSRRSSKKRSSRSKRRRR